MNGISAPSVLLLCKDPARKGPSVNQGAGSHGTPSQPGPTHPRTMRKQCLSHTVHGIFVIAA